jgi:hypothetical protein
MKSFCRIGAAALLSLLAVACSVTGPAHGTVTGHLYGVGGPSPGSPRAWPGTVTLTGAGTQSEVRVGASGAYSVHVPPGRYTLTGHSPQYGGRSYLCRATGPVTVTSGSSVVANVWCQLA